MSIHFMLAPDAQSGAVIRKKFAAISALNVKVGTFDILLDLLLEYWLIPNTNDNNWRTKLSHNALSMPDTFWYKSIKTDEKSVIDELDTTLEVLLNALPLDINTLPRIEEAKTRYSKYYTDVSNLHNKMGNIFPETLSKARLWNKSSNLKALEEIIVYCDSSIQLEAWQIEIINQLQSSQNNDFNLIYEQAFSSHSNSVSKDIKYLQASLFLDQKIDQKITFGLVHLYQNG